MMGEVVTLTPTSGELEAETAAFELTCMAIEITSAEMFRIAGEELHELKAQIRALEDRRKQITRPMDESKKSVMALFSPHIGRRTLACDAIEERMRTWANQQKSVAKIAQAAADAAMPEGMIAPLAAPAVPKVAGVRDVKRWHGKVSDETAFLHWLADNPLYRGTVIDFSQSGMNELARRAAENNVVIPGFDGEQVAGYAA